MDFWKDKSKGIVQTELYSVRAKEIVGKFFYKDRNGKTQKELDSTQLRKFYNDVLIIKTKINNAEDMELEFDIQLPYLNMLRAKVQYSESRKNIKKLNSNFKWFINESLSQIEDLNDFKVFCTLFESVIAYFGK